MHHDQVMYIPSLSVSGLAFQLSPGPISMEILHVDSSGCPDSASIGYKCGWLKFKGSKRLIPLGNGAKKKLVRPPWILKL